MSQVIDLCEGDDNGEWPNAASVPPLPLSRKRRRDNKEESSNDAHPRNENYPGNKTATGWATFVFDLELAEEVEVGVSLHRKRRSIMKSERSAKNDAAEKIAQTQKGVQATGKDVGSEDAQSVDHDESHEGIAAAASHPMYSDSELTSRDDLSANKRPQKRLTSRGTAWEDRLSELADYRKVHGHCNVPCRYNENAKLGRWVATQRYQYGLTSTITLPRIQALQSLGFEWGSRDATWEVRLSELAEYRKVHGHCNVPRKYSENSKLGMWVTNQRSQYSLHLKGNTSQITLPRIQALESLGFVWNPLSGPWEDRLSELADYRKVHGHCNVPRKYRENAKLGAWVATQRYQYSLHLKGKTSAINLPRIQALERLGFEWKPLISRGHGITKNSNLDDDVTSARERAVESIGIKQPYGVKMPSTALLVAGPPENNFSVAAKKPANSRQGAESQPETALSNEILLRTNPVAPAEPLQQSHNNMLGDGSTTNSVQAATPDKPTSAAPQDMMQPTPRNEVFQSDNVLREELV
jgi:hypothetical protein